MAYINKATYADLPIFDVQKPLALMKNLPVLVHLKHFWIQYDFALKAEHHGANYATNN